MKYLFFLISLLISSIAPAQDEFDDQGTFTPNFFAELLDVENYDDSTIYVLGVGGIIFLDVSDMQNPSFIGRYHPGDIYKRFYNGKAQGNIALCAARRDGIYAVNIFSKTNPTLYSIYKPPGRSFESVDYAGNVAYAAAHQTGVEVLDISNPLNMQRIRTLGTSANSWDVFIDGSELYVADGAGGLKIYSLQDPANPQGVTTVQTSGAAREVIVEAGYAYVALGAAGFDIIDVRDPFNPRLMSHVDNLFGITNHLNYGNGVVFSATWELVTAVDVSDPANPYMIATEDTPLRAMGIGVNGNRIFVADWSKMHTYNFARADVADIHVKPTLLDFGFDGIGVPISHSFQVFNLGETSLDIPLISRSDIQFEISPTNLVVSPGTVEEITVTFTPTANNIVQNRLKFFSNDPDESPKEILTFGGKRRLAPGDTAPDFTLKDLKGNWHSLSDYRGKVVVMAFFASW